MPDSILHVVNGLGLGGTERLCVDTVKAAPKFARPIVLNAFPGRRDLLAELAPGIPVLECLGSLGNRGEFIRFVSNAVREYQVRGLVSYSFGALHLATSIGAHLGGLHRIVACAGNTAPVDRLSRAKWASVLLGSMALRTPIVSASAAVDRSLRSLGVGMPNESMVILNGVDVDRFSPPQRESHEFVVGMVARLDDIKDQETLVRAFRRVHERFPETRLWLIGDGPNKGTIDRLVDRLGLRSRVELLGKRTDVPRLLHGMTIFVLSTTEAEGFGIVLAEAMASGVVCIASRVAACREVLREGELGLLVPPGDVSALADAIEGLLSDRARRQALANRALAFAREHYSAKRSSLRLHRLALGVH